jgi:serine/threonine protein kinase
MTVGAANTDGDPAGPTGPTQTGPTQTGPTQTGPTQTGPTQTGADVRTAPPAAALRSGDPRRLGSYRMLGRLGEGGMGTVFLGSAAGGRLVAIKVIRGEYAQDETFRRRFRAEANAAQRVARFCTAQVLDVDTDGDITYLVTEYIDGPTLAAALARDGPLHGSMLDSLAIGVAVALNGIHAANVVHRDLKPSNVLLSRVGPKVIDFGIARALDGLDTLTDAGQVVGTPAYMAPEQFRGTATAATDVFAWGSVVSFAGTGRTPFGDGSPYELMRRITSDEPDIDGLDRPLRNLVEQALDKQPQRRPSARALLLTLVGEVDDPVDASTRILSSSWTPPLPQVAVAPTANDAPPLDPTRPDDRRTVSTPGRRQTSSRVRARVVGGAAIAAVALVAALLLLKDWTPGPSDGAGQRSDRSGTASPPAGAVPGSEQRSGDATGSANRPEGVDPQPVTLGTRVPASGVTTLGVGEVHRFRLRLPAAREVYLQGTEGCAHLLPWILVRSDGSTVANGVLSCRTDGPVGLSAGEYELRVGGDGVDGKYAFMLIGR